MGVGILVLGTPFLLILDYTIVEVFFILLPLSIKTSLINLIIMRTFNKKLEISSYKELKKFFINDNFSQAEKFSKRSLVLPICSTLTKKQLDHVVKSVNSFK